jgi:hypothetical protein
MRRTVRRSRRKNAEELTIKKKKKTQKRKTATAQKRETTGRREENYAWNTGSYMRIYLMYPVIASDMLYSSAKQNKQTKNTRKFFHI